MNCANPSNKWWSRREERHSERSVVGVHRPSKMKLSRRFTATFAALILAAGFGIAAGTAQGSEGRLDPSYGMGGVAMTSLGTAGYEVGAKMTIRGASVFVANGFAGTATLFSASGSVDKRFGQKGWFVVKPGAPLRSGRGLKFYPSSLAIDRRGRVLAFGYTVNPSQQGQGPGGGPVSPNLGAVLRFGRDHKLDPTFGRGDGFVIGRFGLLPDLSTGFPRIGVLEGRVDGAGRPLFVVGSATTVGGCEGGPSVEFVPGALVRLTASGELDSSFGHRGRSSVFGAGDSPALSLDARDQAVVGVGNVGNYAARCGEGSIIYRFGSDGEPLRSFGADGKRVCKSMHLAVAEPSGASVLAEDRGSLIEVSRLRPDGTRRLSFGRHGVARIGVPRGRNPHVMPVAVDGERRILLAGDIETQPRSGTDRPGRSSFVVGRLLPDGSVDRSFGKGGWLTSRLGGGLNLLDVHAALDSKGRLLAAGFVSDQRRHNGNGGFAVARYLVGG